MTVARPGEKLTGLYAKLGYFKGTDVYKALIGGKEYGCHLVELVGSGKNWDWLPTNKSRYRQVQKSQALPYQTIVKVLGAAPLGAKDGVAQVVVVDVVHKARRTQLEAAGFQVPKEGQVVLVPDWFLYTDDETKGLDAVARAAIEAAKKGRAEQNAKTQQAQKTLQAGPERQSGTPIDKICQYIALAIHSLVPNRGDFASVEFDLRVPIWAGKAGLYIKIIGGAEHDTEDRFKIKFEFGLGLYGELDAEIVVAFIKIGAFGYLESDGGSALQALQLFFYPLYRLVEDGDKRLSRDLFGGSWSNLLSNQPAYAKNDVEGAIGGEFNAGLSWGGAVAKHDGEFAVGLGVAAAKSWRTGRVYSLLRFSMKLKNASGLQFEGALEVVAKDGKAQLKLLGMAGANAKVTAPEIDGLARRALSIARGNNFLLPPTPAAMPGDLTRSASATAGVEIVCDATSPGSQWKIYGVAQVVVVINLPANGSVTLATGTKRQLYPAPP